MTGWENVLICVTETGSAILYSEPQIDDYKFENFLKESQNNVLLDDNGVDDIPEEPGIYKCFISCITTQDYSGDYDCICKVVNPIRVWRTE